VVAVMMRPGDLVRFRQSDGLRSNDTARPLRIVFKGEIGYVESMATGKPAALVRMGNEDLVFAPFELLELV